MERLSHPNCPLQLSGGEGLLLLPPLASLPPLQSPKNAGSASTAFSFLGCRSEQSSMQHPPSTQFSWKGQGSTQSHVQSITREPSKVLWEEKVRTWQPSRWVAGETLGRKWGPCCTGVHVAYLTAQCLSQCHLLLPCSARAAACFFCDPPQSLTQLEHSL